MRALFFVAAIAACIAGEARASCGAAFCVLDTNWATQGTAAAPGSARVDLRYEFVDQKRLLSGSRRIAQAGDTGDTTELRTINRNLLATLDYALSRHWTLSGSLPAVSRSHSHIADPAGAATLESWNFTEPGDARILGYYRFGDDAAPLANYGLAVGLKLPTGDYRLKNADGTTAERALQPGSGSTDALLGAYYSGAGTVPDSSWFVQGLAQQAIATKDGFRPGSQLTLNFGYRHPLAPQLHAMLQLNALVRGRDGGVNAEPELSGSKSVFFSPGLSYALSHDVQIYGFVQLPLYRHVNGVQLSADRALVGGITARF